MSRFEQGLRKENMVWIVSNRKEKKDERRFNNLQEIVREQEEQEQEREGEREEQEGEEDEEGKKKNEKKEKRKKKMKMNKKKSLENSTK